MYDIVNTGDNSPITILIALGVVAVIALAVLLNKRKK